MAATAEKNKEKSDTLSLWGAVSLGTGVMVGAGILALTGQIAELSREWFIISFLLGACVAGLSAYTYIKLSQAYPSSGGIVMFLEKAYGKSTVTAVCALLMFVSMVINESLVARTFGNYTAQLFDASHHRWLVPGMGLALIAASFSVNLLSNDKIQKMSFFMAFLKVSGLLALAFGGLYAAGFKISAVVPWSESGVGAGSGTDPVSFAASIAIAVLAYKGFTTITNSGGELVNAEKNVARAIIITLLLCTGLYFLVTWAVGANLSIDEIIKHKNYVLAEAAQPAYGKVGRWITIGFAVLATISGITASMFAVSRMLAMLTDMKLVPHSHFGMPGSIQKHTLVYTAVIAAVLTLSFDLSGIVVMGAIFYLMMDIAVHYGVFKHLRSELEVKSSILILAIFVDLVLLFALIWNKAQTHAAVLGTSAGLFVLIVVGERMFLKHYRQPDNG